MAGSNAKVFISKTDQYLFGQGTHYEIYTKLGAHLSEENGVKGPPAATKPTFLIS